MIITLTITSIVYIGTVVICMGKAKFEENIIIEFHNVGTLLIKLIKFLQINLNAGFKSYTYCYFKTRCK